MIRPEITQDTGGGGAAPFFKTGVYYQRDSTLTLMNKFWQVSLNADIAQHSASHQVVSRKDSAARPRTGPRFIPRTYLSVGLVHQLDHESAMS